MPFSIEDPELPLHYSRKVGLDDFHRVDLKVRLGNAPFYEHFFINKLLELCTQFNVLISTISTNLTKIGKVKKLNKLVPHLLNEKLKEKRYEITSMLLNRNDTNQFLNRIITYD